MAAVPYSSLLMCWRSPKSCVIRLLLLKTADELFQDVYKRQAQAYTGVFRDGRISCNEALVGKALKDVRHHVVIATKMGVAHNADRSLRLSLIHI